MPADLASLLTDLKRRSGLSYDVIGRRTHISKSTIHRYCRGESVPPDFATVERIAALCGATAAEQGQLHLSWNAAAAAMADAAPDPTQPDPVPSGPADGAAGPTGAARSPARRRGRGPGWRLGRAVAVGLATVLALSGVSLWWPRTDSDADPSHWLLDGPCAAPVGLGRSDGCVQELQRLLANAGADIEVDGTFGPVTLGKVTAYQMLAKLPVTGVADLATKRALYSHAVTLQSWPAERVEARIREVFREAPDLAVRVAHCRSRLDPLYATPNPDRSRNWGVFQLSDALVSELGGTPLLALDPEWNIRATHRRYLASGDFGDRACYRANHPPGPASAEVASGRRAPPR
ncbi:peptidoglycan-binding protein [Pilimelia anulata]|uniref:Peptidoglycan-binding protein n=1 Tax=Pilimelia anulata TaxID=53371 RepID=A0A8J3AZT2_9ACTN|nr:peptidoglycan-binding protein [Pilimelia anulata]